MREHRHLVFSFLVAATSCTKGQEALEPQDASGIDLGYDGRVADLGTPEDLGAGDADAGSEDVPPPDGASDAGGCTVSGTRTVTGSWINRYYSESGMRSAPEDLRNITIRVYVENEAKNCFVEKWAEKTNGGQFRVQDMPEGRYYLRLHDFLFEYYVTSADHFELGYSIHGEPESDAVQDPNTTINFGLDGFQPFNSRDRIQLYSFDRGVMVFDLPYSIAAALNPGDTTLSGVLPYLIEVSPTWLLGQDRVYVYQVAEENLPDGDARTRLSRVSSRTMTLQDGDQVDWIDTMVAPRPTQTGSISWRRQGFADVMAAPCAGRSAVFDGFAVQAALGAHAGWTGELPILEGRSGFGGPDLEHAYTFANPFTSTSELVSAAYECYTNVVLPDGTELGWNYSIQANRTLDPSGATVLEPQVGPVQQISVSAGLAPVISWRAPAVGTAHGYYVSLGEVEPGVTPGVLYLAHFWTTETELRVPDGLLEEGKTYFVGVASHFAPNVAWDREGLRQELPYGSAEAPGYFIVR